MNASKKILGGIAAVIVLIILIIGVNMALIDVDAGQIVVVQSIGGDLTVITDPGWKWRGAGSVTVYPRRQTFSFSARKDQGNTTDESIQTRFNDGGHGNISGTVSWQMPLKPVQVIAIHKDFRSIDAINQQLIRVAMQKVIYNVGPTMSSTESSAEKRPDIPKYIDDQLVNGPYLTKTVQQTIKDPISGQDKVASVVVIATGADGQPLREAKSQLTAYGIIVQPVSIEAINYDPVVETQIKQRQEATTAVQISIANARKAEQAAITTAKEGEATAAKAKWEQEAANAKDIAAAERDKQVAELAAQTAEAKKKALILEGQGEAEKRKLILEADGALDKKLEAYVAVNKAYATAIQSAQPGAWTPQTVMGTTSTGNGASALVDLLTAKTASQMGLDLTMTRGTAAKK